MGLKVTGNMLFSGGATFVSPGLLTHALGRESYLLLSLYDFYSLKRDLESEAVLKM